MRTIDTVNSTILLAIELSASSWLVAARVPGSDKPHLHRIDGGNTVGLLALISSLRDRVARRLNVAIGVVCCFEAGRDGFWLHRLLTVHGVANYVLEPTSILINRRARRAKTDRLDAVGMLRVLAAHLRGDRQSCSMVRVPAPDEEDAKRIHRERESLVQERLRIENRIEALLSARSRPNATRRPRPSRKIGPVARSPLSAASVGLARTFRPYSHERYSIGHSTTAGRSQATSASRRCPTRAVGWTAIVALAAPETRVLGRP
jgi:hypothetical protein